MEQLIAQLRQTGVVPVVKLDDPKDALPLAQALRQGGLCCAEITFRTAAAEEAIRRIAEAYPDFLVAAGTVLTPEQADTAMAAGASLLVSPGLNPQVVRHCLAQGYPVIPGVCTPTEVEAALALGLTHLKFFPAEAAGGIKMIQAMAAPYTMVRFMPTGGINATNLRDYLTCKPVFACGGSWMVSAKLINSGNFSEIQRLTAEAVALVKEIQAS